MHLRKTKVCKVVEECVSEQGWMVVCQLKLKVKTRELEFLLKSDGGNSKKAIAVHRRSKKGF